MPVNDRYPLDEVIAECLRYYELRRRKVFVEYVMLAGVNDSLDHARGLAELLDPKIFKVNMIPYNPTGMCRRSVAGDDGAFKDALHGSGFSPTLAAHARTRHRRRVRQLAADVGG